MSTTPTPREVAIQTLAWIEDMEREKHDGIDWDQEEWAVGEIDRDLAVVPEGWLPVCGSVACVAGYSALAAGGVLVHSEDGRDEAFDVQVTAPDVYTTSGVIKHVMTAGKEALGLTQDQAGYLFDGERDYTEVTDFLRDLIAGREPWIGGRDA